MALTAIPVSLLLVAEYLPDHLIPLNPTYLKHVGAQTLVVVGLVALLIGRRGEGMGQDMTIRSAAAHYAFPILLLSYAAWCLLSLLWTSWSFGGTNYLLRETTFFGLAILSFFALHRPERWKTFCVTFLVSATFAAVWQGQSLVAAALSSSNVTLAGAFLRRPFMFGNINFACATMTTGALIGTSLLLVCARDYRRAPAAPERRRLVMKMLGCAAAIAVQVFILVTASSLAGYLAAGVAVIAYALCLLPLGKKRWMVVGGLIALVFAGLMVLLYVPNFRRSAIRRALKPGTTTRARVVWWTATADMFTKKPLQGWGLGAYGSTYYHFAPPIADEAPPTRGVAATHPHNEFLRIAAELGVIGFLLYGLTLAAALIGGYRAFRQADFPRGALGFAIWTGILGYLTQAALGKAVQIWDMALPYWLLLGAVAGAGHWEEMSPGKVLPRGTARWIVAGVATVALGTWWWIGAVGGYRSLLILDDAHARVNALADYAFDNQEAKDKPEIRETALRAARRTSRDILAAGPHCPVPTTPLKLRYSMAVNLASLGLNHRACREFMLVQDHAPGFLRVERYLADCYRRRGDKKTARRLLISFLERHPARTGAYIDLARIDLRTATDMLLTQVVERDGFTDPARIALAGRMLSAQGRWEHVRRLLEMTKRLGSRQALEQLGGEIAAFCESFDKPDQLESLRRDFPDAFPPPDESEEK